LFNYPNLFRFIQWLNVYCVTNLFPIAVYIYMWRLNTSNICATVVAAVNLGNY